MALAVLVCPGPYFGGFIFRHGLTHLGPTQLMLDFLKCIPGYTSLTSYVNLQVRGVLFPCCHCSDPRLATMELIIKLHQTKGGRDVLCAGGKLGQRGHTGPGEPDGAAGNVFPHALAQQSPHPVADDRGANKRANNDPGNAQVWNGGLVFRAGA